MALTHVFGNGRGAIADAARGFGISAHNLRHMIAGRRPVPDALADEVEAFLNPATELLQQLNHMVVNAEHRGLSKQQMRAIMHAFASPDTGDSWETPTP